MKSDNQIQKYLTSLGLASGDHIRAAKAFKVKAIDAKGVDLSIAEKTLDPVRWETVDKEVKITHTDRSPSSSWVYTYRDALKPQDNKGYSVGDLIVWGHYLVLISEIVGEFSRTPHLEGYKLERDCSVKKVRFFPSEIRREADIPECKYFFTNEKYTYREDMKFNKAMRILGQHVND